MKSQFRAASVDGIQRRPGMDFQRSVGRLVNNYSAECPVGFELNDFHCAFDGRAHAGLAALDLSADADSPV